MLPAENLQHHHIHPLLSHMNFQENHYTQDVEDGLDEAQCYKDKVRQIFSLSEALQEQPLGLGLQFKVPQVHYWRKTNIW